jgi:hypothetical protein
MEKPKEATISIVEAQQQLTRFATTAENLWSQMQTLAEQLDEPLSETQAYGLDPEPLPAFISDWLTTSDEIPLASLAERLTKIARLRQEDIDRAWRLALPVSVAELASRRLRDLEEAARDVLAAASERDGRRVAVAMETLCRRMDDDGPLWKDLASHARRYLAGKATTPVEDDVRPATNPEPGHDVGAGKDDADSVPLQEV